MARKLYYKVVDDGKNIITDEQWDSIIRLQHWYNSEFIWTAGRLGFRMYAVFPNVGISTNDIENLKYTINQRRRQLRAEGYSDNETIKKLESEGLIIVQKGGYYDNCIASGFTRVAGNELNAYLVCEFLLKASSIAETAVISAYDEGNFIKSKDIKFQNGGIILQVHDRTKLSYYNEIINNHHIFSVVDPAKYDNHPRFRTTIADFNELDFDEKLGILKEWNWLGFENNYDRAGDDIQGFNLNQKVDTFQLLTSW